MSERNDPWFAVWTHDWNCRAGVRFMRLAVVMMVPFAEAFGR